MKSSKRVDQTAAAEKTSSNLTETESVEGKL